MSQLILNKLKSLQQQKEKQKFWNITWEQGVFLSSLIDLKKPKRVLEIGTSNGFSTLWIAKNLDKDSIIDTIEVQEERFNIANNNFKACNIENINSINGNALDIIKNLRQSYDFFLVDAAQAFYFEMIKIFEQLKMINKDAILIFDNISSHSNMKEFVDYMNKNYKIELIEIGDGFLFAKN